MVSDLEKAIQLAVKAHLGQKDKAGAPYILHPLRVMMQMDTESEMTAAVLHDVVEDSSYTITYLAEQGFANDVLDSVDCLTRKAGQSYEQFIENITKSPMARKIKTADIRDNINIFRITNLTDKDWERLKRYHRAWQVLTQA